ncbi:MAG: hypothetical protein AN482_19640 [Anabaena sp. LE011-02]|jgi:tetratricopeptide (TPR) repeat protein|nr:MAG: hypothetical protein AN482_19640 [Anabaena sp. LE011-02]
MAHPLYQKRIENDIKLLVSTSFEVESIKHRGLRGAFRESILGQVIRKYLPFGWDLGSGEIVDSVGNSSSEVDLLIYNKSAIPPVLFSESEGCYPIESCYYVFEIKTTSTAQEIQTTLEKFRSLRNLQSLNSKIKPITVYFAYNTDLTSQSEFERYTKYDKNFDNNPLIDVICIIGKGYWFNIKTPDSIGWHFFEAENNNFEVGLFLSGVVNTINPQQKFGYYVINNGYNRKIIYYKDFVRNFVITFENSEEFTAGHREYSNGNHEMAIDCFSKVILDQKKLASFLVKFGMETLDATGNVKYLSKAIELDNDLKHDYRLFERLGISYYNLAKANSEKFSKNIEESIINFQLALGLNPGNPNLSNYLANAKQLNQHEN